MEIESTRLAGVKLLRPNPHRDHRGLFTRTFDAGQAASQGMVLGDQAQDSQSRSAAGVVRGLHGRAGLGEAKLVRCARGAVLDVIVDARLGSPTFGEHVAVVLDDVDFLAVWIPAGCLHGFQVLSNDEADVCYRIDRPHDRRDDQAVHWNDPDLNLPWRRSQPITVSDRDAAAGSWAEFVRGLRD